MKKYIPSILFIFLLFTKSFSSIASFNKPLLNETLADTLHLNFIKQDLKCNSDNSGYAVVKVSGGKAPYSYSWNNDAIVDSIGNLSAGVYTVTVTDAVGTMQKGSVEITEPAMLQAITSNNNVSCFGGSNAYASVEPQGGTFPYSYYWTNDKGSQYISGLFAGEYGITIIDKNGCNVSKSVIITEPSPISISVINAGNRNFTAEASGGVGSYAYKWNTGQEGATLTNPTSGTYTVTVTDGNTCSKVYTTVIDNPEPVSPLTLSFNKRDLKCNGDNSGYAVVKVSGGKSPYTYSWNNNAIVDSIGNLSAGTYTLTVTDAVGQTIQGSVSVQEPQPLKIQLNTSLTNKNITAQFSGGTGQYSLFLNNAQGSEILSDVNYNFTYSISLKDSQGQPIDNFTYLVSNGTAFSLKVFKGKAPFSIKFTFGEWENSFSNLIDGVNYLILKDKNGCEKTYLLNVEVVPSLAVAVTGGGVSCYGGSNGTATAKITGGTAPYRYLWSNGQKTSTISNLIAGKYSVIVQDTVGFVARDTVEITQPSPINISVVNDGNRNFTAQATGGVGSYTYQWNTGQEGATLINPTSGTYTVTVTDGNACSQVYTTVINNPEPLTLSYNKGDLKCNGDNSGYAKVQVSGGKTPYTYSWSNKAIVDSIGNLSAGTYTVTVTDAVGNIKTVSVVINQPDKLSAYVSLDGGVNSAIYIKAEKQGGTAPYQYLWSDGAKGDLLLRGFGNLPSYVDITDANGCYFRSNATELIGVSTPPALKCSGDSTKVEVMVKTNWVGIFLKNTWSDGKVNYIYSPIIGTTNTISSYHKGGKHKFTLSVNFANTGNFISSYTDSITITQPSPINISVINAGNRNFIAQATGGVGSYKYKWNTGQEGATLTNPPSGTHTVTVTDGNACSKVYTTVIDNPDPMVLSFASSSTRCYNEPSAFASVSVVGGKEPYRYLWSNGETSASITNLYAGNYTVTITDEAGQTLSGSVIISQPSPLQVAVSNTAIKCFGANNGTAFVNDVSGGTPPYNFEWNTGQFTTYINNLGVGNYSVLVRDEKGCSVEKSVTITEPSPITYTFDSKDVKCFNGTDGIINFYVEGGTGAYKYIYNENYSENSTLSTLSAGKYNIRVEDTNACQSQLSEVNIAQPNQIQITLLSEQNPKGFGTLDGIIKVNISGGTIADTQSYQTLWFAEESSINSTNKFEGEIVQNTLENIKGGTYNLLVKDLNYDLSSSNQGCMATFSHVLNQPRKLILASTITDKVSCYGKSDAKVSVQAEGGVKIDDKNPYTYEWYRVNSNELLKLETTSPNLEFVDAGTYRVVATDANAIKASVDVVVENPLLMTYQFTKLKSPSCPSSNDGLIAIEVSGGVGTKTVTWSNNLMGFSINHLEQGKYYGVIQDEANCIAEVAVMLNPQENVVVELLEKKELICTELCDGAIEVKVSGNSGNYELTWSNGMKGTKIDNLCAGQYSVEVNTDLGCKTSLSNIDLKAPEPFKIEISNDLTICADAKVTIDAQALLPNNQNYEWTLPNKTKQTNPKLSISEAGTYIIEITNKDKCKATDVFNVKVLNKVSGVSFALSSAGKLGETIYAINLTPTEVATEWKTFGNTEIVSNAISLLAFKAKSEGDIKVVLQSISGDCNISVEKTISIKGSVEVKGNSLLQSLPIETLILAYPNPNSGNFFVESDSLINGNVEVTIYNSNFAKKLFYEQYDNKEKHKVEVSLPQLSTGDVIYLDIKANNQRTVKKIMIL